MLSSDRIGRLYWVVLEIAGYTNSLEKTTKKLCDLIRSLPRRERALWNRALLRELNIGIQAGLAGDTFGIEEATVQAAASIRARIAIVIYGAKRPKPKRLGRSS